jgi:DNA-binding transcriptional LysR family regulator
MNDVNWNLWRTFEAVLECGTLSGAARRLGTAQPTVGRQIEALETSLGYPLFLRSSQGFVPTDAARGLQPLARTLASTAGALDRMAGVLMSEESGSVRVTASQVASVEILPAIIASFTLANPQVAVELSANNSIEDLLTREADIAVRMTPPTQQALIGRRVGEVAINLYAHRTYLERSGTPLTVDDLRQHRLIGYDAQLGIYSWLNSIGIDVDRHTFKLRTDDEPTQVALIRAGAGIGGMQDRLAERSADLVQVMGDKIRLPMDIWVVMHEDLRRIRPVRLMFDHLVSELTGFVRGSKSQS